MKRIIVFVFLAILANSLSAGWTTTPSSSVFINTTVSVAASATAAGGNPLTFLTIWKQNPVNGQWSIVNVATGANGQSLNASGSGVLNLEGNWIWEATTSSSNPGSSPSGTVVAGPTTTTVSRYPQSVTITPSSQAVYTGSSITFTASGGNTSYNWGGSAAGSGTTNTVTFNSAGTFTVTVQDPGNATYSPSNVASATITVTVNNTAPTVTSLSASPASIAFGQSATITGVMGDVDGNLYAHGILLLTDDSTNWMRPNADYSRTGWNVFPVSSDWSSPDHVNDFASGSSDSKGAVFTPHRAGYFVFQTNGHDGALWGAALTFGYTVAMATPTGNFSARTYNAGAGVNTYTVVAGNLNATFSNPYSGAVAAPTGAVTYSIAPGSALGVVGSAVTVGTVLSAQGNYTVRATSAADANYNSATADAIWTIINPAPVNVSMTVGGPYGFGQAITGTVRSTDANADLVNQHIVASWSGLWPTNNWETSDTSGWKWRHLQTYGVSGGDATSSFTLNDANYGQGANFYPGTYHLTVNTQDTLPNYTYNAATILATFVVNKATPVGTFAGANKTPQSGTTYTAVAGDFNATFANPYTGVVTTPSGAISYAIAPGSPNGTAGSAVTTGSIFSAGLIYKIRATIAADTNYNGAVVDSTWTVNQSPQTITFANPGAKTFGTTFTPAGTASSGLPVSYTITSGPASIAGNVVSFSAVGLVTIKASQAGNSSYSAAPDVIQSFQVNPIIITAATLASLNYNGAAQSPSVASSVTPAGATVSVSAPVQTNAGTYTTATITGTGNYSGTLTGVSWTINKLTVTGVTFASLTYNGSPQSPTSANISSTVPVGATVSVSAPSQTNAGTYTTATVTGTGNYTGTLTNRSWTISTATQAAVSITSVSTTTYGTSYTATATGGSGTGALVWSLATSGSTASGAAIDSSTGLITANSTGVVNIKVYRAGDSNFPNSATTSNFPVTFNARPITVTLSGSKTYDGTASPTSAAATITTGSPGVGDTVGFAYGATSSANFGTYAASATFPTVTVSNTVAPTSRTANYVITYAGNYTINKATLTAATITALTYTGSPQSPSSTSSRTPTAATVTVTAAAQTNAATYTTATVAGTGNYSGTLTSVSWTINKANQTITSANGTVVFGQSFTPTVTGALVAGANQWTVTGQFGFVTVGAWAPPAVGSFSFQVKNTGSANYNAGTSSTYTLTASKATPNVTFGNRTLTMAAGMGNYFVTATDLNATFANPTAGTSVAQPGGVATYSIATGSPNGVTGNPVIASTALSVGSYLIQVSYPTDTNYNATSATATWLIELPASVFSQLHLNQPSDQATKDSGNSTGLKVNRPQ